mmetsp:Transcript_54324/g.48900  ORF Transcript_54324/g.48900 Transcript_54324/m.48900 type:complete len:526 (+) Transcript_54324:49-1626(+)
MAEESSSSTPPSKSKSKSALKPQYRSNSHTLTEIKKKTRYRNSVSTESPIVMLTPPNPDEVVREERRLSNASAHSIASSAGSSGDGNNDPDHLAPPPEPEPEEIVAKLISQRRPSTITTLSQVIKQIFIDKKIKEDGVPSKIIDGLYLGSIGAAKNLQWLKSNNITHILCVAGGIGQCYPKQFIYKVIDINDAPSEDISSHFKSSFTFIENAINIKHGNVLCHCFAGMSRSVTVTAAYLMQKNKMHAVPALKFVKQCRQQANPNAGFIVQLIKFQNIIGLPPSTNNSPNVSDNEDHNDEEEEEEEKADKPKTKTLKSLKSIANKSLTIRLNSPEVKEWENGRRPSLFTALAKLRGMKNRARANSTDSVHSTHSNISAMSSADNKSDNVDNINNNNNSTNNGLLAVVVNNHSNKSDDNNPVSPISPLGQIDLHILKEVSNETDDDNILAATKNKNELDLNYLSKHIASDTKEKSDNDTDDPITPLENYNDPFPDTPTDKDKTTIITTADQSLGNGSKPIKVITTQL